MIVWEGVLMRGTASDIGRIADAATDLVAQFGEKKSLKLGCLGHEQWPEVWKLGWQGFRNNRSVAWAAPVPPLHQAVIQSFSGSIREALSYGSVEFELAALVGKLVGRSAWVCYADGLCESAYALFEQDRVAASLWVDVDTHPSDYGAAAVEGMKQFMPHIEYVDEFLDAIYGSGAHGQDYIFIESGVACVPPRLRE